MAPATPDAASPDVEARVHRILTERLGVPAEEVRLDARLVEDLGLDSLDAVELAIAAERQFGVGIAEEEVARLSTVGDIVALVRALQGEEGTP